MVSIRHTQYPGGITVVHFWLCAVCAWGEWQAGKVTGREWRPCGQRIWMLFYRQPLKGFQEGSEMIRYSFKKDCSDRERGAGLERWCMEFSGEAPPCGLSESWCTLDWAVGMRRKPGPRADKILSIENPWQWQLRNGVERRGEVLSDFWQGKCVGCGTFNWDGEYRPRVGFVIVGLIFRDGCGY